MLILLYIAIIACVCFQAERGVFDFHSYLCLFYKLKQGDKKIPDKSTKKVLFILIPALREQEIIENTVLKFIELKNFYFDIKIAVVTSIREISYKRDIDIPTTEEILTQSIHTGKLSRHKNRIHIFQDQDAQGNMATQLNYAIEKIKTFMGSDMFYVIYNADSIVSETTLNKLAELMEQYPDKEFAVQQPCAFVRDMHPNANQFTNAMSLYQSWYCLGHESRLVRNYGTRSEKYWGKNKNTKLGVVVGHGSGMTIKINTDNGGYPTDLLTEDLTFGFIISANNVPILSLPALELADVPNHFTTFIKQKSVWFWNFLGYAKCYQKALKRGHSHFRLIPLFLQGLGAGAYWFFDTFFIIIPFMGAIILHSYWVLLFSIASVFIFYIIPQYFLLKKLPAVLRAQNFPDYASNVESISFIKLLPNLFLIILTNSIGAWIATLRAITYLITGKLPIKYRTGD